MAKHSRAVREAALTGRHARLLDTSFTVDAFSYGAIEGCSAYFLTHFHSDHYQGLSKSFAHGPIYCTSVTANLVAERLKVPREQMRPLPLDTTLTIDSVRVTLIDANHCPGAAIILFEVPDASSPDGWRRHLHTGDFRAIPAHVEHAAIAKCPSLDMVYLDTTYLDPSYAFPAQSSVLEATVRTATTTTTTSSAASSRVLFVVGTYLIGKERVFQAIANAIGSKIYVTEEKQRILACLEDERLASLITTEPSKANVHVVSMNQLNRAWLTGYLDHHREAGFTSLVAFRPTGWSYKSKRQKDAGHADSGSDSETADPVSNAAVRWPCTAYSVQSLQSTKLSSDIVSYSVPYSEHSSFDELAAFVRSLSIRGKVQPTVNLRNDAAVRKMTHWLGRWMLRR
ncbi:beta-lactamase-like protein [Syncephalis pseudoplumigaleata]|uniref:Beta-lactamase-like protein n=1 Tax=Syncephalis pseudoplumigaleata TaxID=1712513 RepID=A0A4P9YY29_9FUNG|nr:beta-lactamase-like protein [Syncephalis pseudoplumigaleata]|eukprot:RKP24241.1 beta-lactamase-like protein [Syncephalis pseudoplumigaleata]